jgi:thioredoxin reductase (NADPH)
VLTGSGAAGSASPFATSMPGIFAVGDVRAGSVKRVASSVGEGSVVISKVWEFVNRKA